MLKYILTLAFLMVAAFWIFIGATELISYISAFLPSMPRWVGFSIFMAYMGGLVGFSLWLIGVPFPFSRR